MSLYLDQAYGPAGDLLRDLADPGHRFHMAKHDAAIIGYAKLSKPWLPAGFAGPDATQLSQLYIDKPWHGHGVAQALMAWTIDTAVAMALTNCCSQSGKKTTERCASTSATVSSISATTPFRPATRRIAT